MNNQIIKYVKVLIHGKGFLNLIILLVFNNAVLGQIQSEKWIASPLDDEISDIILMDNSNKLALLYNRFPLTYGNFFDRIINTESRLYIWDDDFSPLDSIYINEIDNHHIFLHEILPLTSDSMLLYGMAYNQDLNDLQICIIWLNSELEILNYIFIGESDEMDYPGEILVNSNDNIVMHGQIDPDWLISPGNEKRFFLEISQNGGTVQYVLDSTCSLGFGLMPLNADNKYQMPGIQSIIQLNSDFSIDTTFDFDYINFELFFLGALNNGQNILLGNYFLGVNPINPDIPDFDLCFKVIDYEAQVTNSLTIGTQDTTDRIGGYDIDGDTIFLGGTKHVMNGTVNNWMKIYKVSLPDSVISEYSFGGYGKYTLNNVLATKDGDCIITGNWWDWVNYPGDQKQNDAVILKVSTGGQINSTNRNNLPINSKVAIYPNPGQNELNIVSGSKDSEIIIFNVPGTRIINQAFSHNITINTTDLKPGLYFYQVWINNELLRSGKWIKN